MVYRSLSLKDFSLSSAAHAEVRMLHVNDSQIFFSKILGASLLFFLPEPGKHSTTMQTGDCEGMNEMVNEIVGMNG